MEKSKKIEQISIKRLNLWEDNPRKNDKAVDRLAELLRTHGFVTPLTVWEEDMVIYKGNTTFKAAKKAGFKRVPCILKDFPSKSAAVAYALADNKSSEWADWDDEVLTKLMKNERLSEDLDSSNTGFTEEELRGYDLSLSDLESVEVPDVDLEGDADVGKSDYMVIQFESKDQREEILNKYGFKIIGYRKIPWKNLKKLILQGVSKETSKRKKSRRRK